MIEKVTIDRFRGIERLAVDGLERVNLVTGKNDCGKTAFIEALGTVYGGSLPTLLQVKRGMTSPLWSFEAFWRPFFFDGDAEKGFAIKASNTAHQWSLSARKEAPASSLLDDASRTGASAWTLLVDARADDSDRSHQIQARGGAVQVVPAVHATEDSVWVSSVSNELTDFDLRAISALKQAGEDSRLVELVRLLNDDVRGVEILAPAGPQAAVFVRTRSKFMLPIGSMGEGTRRCFDVAIGIVGGARLLFIDEIDNGLHHSTLENIWRWIAQVSKQRGVQVFATTHSEECIRAAAHAFAALGDDGFRLLRLDRGDNETTAAVYDRDLVLSAERNDVEVRG